MGRWVKLLIFVGLLGLAGGQDRADAFEWNHIGPDYCSTITTIENPIECRDQEGDTSSSHDDYGSSDDRDAIERGRERQHDAASYADRTWQRWRRQQCEQDRALYIVRHPLVKPVALRELSGCRLYAADAAYHSEVRDAASPLSPTGLLLGLIA